jgi:S-adenosylmethionine:tRNA ribosyltransferase-isomerase
MLARLRDKGVQLAWLTLHVGAGTFQPVRARNLAEHRMHSEYYEIPQATVEAIARAHGRTRDAVGPPACARSNGRARAARCGLGPIVTGVREPMYLLPERLVLLRRRNRLFITPGYTFRSPTG